MTTPKTKSKTTKSGSKNSKKLDSNTTSSKDKYPFLHCLEGDGENVKIFVLVQSESEKPCDSDPTRKQTPGRAEVDRKRQV